MSMYTGLRWRFHKVGKEFVEAIGVEVGLYVDGLQITLRTVRRSPA